ncbi:hypothetical protein D3C72_1969710 [compost metagenome]
MAAAIIVERIDLVGEDPQAVAACEFEDRPQVLVGRSPAGGIGRRVDEQAARLRRDRLFEPIHVERPAAIGEGERNADGAAAGDLDGGDDVRPGRRQIDHLVARFDDRLGG